MLVRIRVFLAMSALLLSGLTWAANVTITTGATSFIPANVTINSGDTVTFTNTSGGFHNAVSNDSGATFNSGAASSSNWTYTTPPLTASIGFKCTIHASMGMTGTITVNTTTPTIKLGGYLSGNWFIPSQGGGQGFQVEMTDSVDTATGKPIMLAIWFVYTPAGSTANDGNGQNWIYAQGDYDPATSTATLPAILLAGARFPPNFVASDVHRVPSDSTLWGSITFAFTDCNNGTVSWHSDLAGYNNANDTPVAIQRITKIAGTTCPQ